MTKARNIADLLDANGDVKSGSLDNVPAVDLTNLSASNLTSGTIPDARITALDASKLTGSIADARIPASAVSQHATSFDDNKIVNDISTLALRQASDQNKSAYNTNSQSVDVFQDDTGIDTTTNALRNASEYVSSFSSSTTNSSSFTINNSNYSTYFSNANQLNYKRDGQGYAITSGGVGNVNNDSSDSLGDLFSTSGQFEENDNSIYHAYWLDFGANVSFDLSGFSIGHVNGQGDLNEVRFFGFNSILTNSVFATQSSTVLEDYELFQNVTGAVALGNGSTWGASSLNTNNDFYRYIGFSRKYGSLNWGSWNNLQLTGITKTITETISSTGNFTGTTITAPSSVSSMGAIITYQDNAGTNALNTDIVLQLSADGGSNYSTATLTALPDFSTGIKMAKVNDLAVTAGTQLKYKLNFANQSSGSKEARIRGVSLQY